MLKIDQLHFAYGANVLFESLSFQLKAGERQTLVGPSGAGKSTLLKLVMGTLKPDGGEIAWNGQSLVKPFIHPHARPITLISQDDTLFPHMTVRANLLYAKPKTPMSELDRWLSALDIHGLVDRYPEELSGGEKQRVMLGRALLYGPALILMDEPFKALDKPLKLTLIDRFKRVFNAVNQTVLTVTHDETVATALGGKIVRLDQGHIETL